MSKRLLLGLLLAAPAELLGWTVAISTPNIVMLSDKHLRASCDGRVETACTTFADTELSCSCMRHGERWSAEVQITSRPHMILSNRMWLEHERTHVYDFEQAMRRHAAQIEGQSFDSSSACEAFGAETRGAFSSVMRQFVRESMRRRDGVPLPDRE
jgi:hypothetical protein